MKTMKKINVDLNLNSVLEGKKKILCFSFDAFLLQWRNLLFGLFLSVGTGKTLELMRSLAFLRHFMATCPQLVWPQKRHLGYMACCSVPKMFWHIIPRSVIFIADLHVLPSHALPRTSSLFISVLGLPCPHFLRVASKSSGFKEPQKSVTFMSRKLREEGSVIAGNQMTRGSRVAGWIMNTSVDPGHLVSGLLAILWPWPNLLFLWVLIFVISTKRSCTRQALSFHDLDYILKPYLLLIRSFWGLPPCIPIKKILSLMRMHPKYANDHVFMFFTSVFL